MDTGSGAQLQNVSRSAITKMQEEDCIVFYAVDSKEKDCLQLKEPKLCGVLYLPDYFLYEVDTAFYEAVGIPADFIFPTREKS